MRKCLFQEYVKISQNSNKMNPMKKWEKKKPQGAVSQRKKPASFIKSLTFIKPSCGARSTNSPQYPQRKKNPPNISPWNPFSPRISVSPRGPLPSENAVRCLTQREAPASLHRPSAPIFSPTIPRPRFSRIAVQLGALSMLGARVGGLGVHFPQPET